jgi:translation elongation factor EF-Tu-like GTPase
MNKSLAELEVILTKHGHLAQANVVARLSELQASDPRAFTDLIQGPEMWGGSGAVWEASFESQAISAVETQDDIHRFRLALIDIAEAMDRLGVGTARSRDIASTVRGWVAMQASGGISPYTRPPSPPDIEAEIEFLPTDKGGRKTAVRSGYRPSHNFQHPEGLSDAQHEYPDTLWVFPGQTARTLLWFIRPEHLAGRIRVGFGFTVQEGGRVVGKGRVVRILNEALRSGA